MLAAPYTTPPSKKSGKSTTQTGNSLKKVTVMVVLE
jgi:hypothetical protein